MSTDGFTPLNTLGLAHIAALGMAVFLALFALDAIGEGPGALLLHLVPALALVGVVVLSWRQPGAGAVLLGALALGYALTARRLDWILAISGPLLLIAALYGEAWRRARRRQRKSSTAIDV